MPTPIDASTLWPALNSADHLRDSLNLVCSILDRYRGQKKALGADEKAAVRRINETLIAIGDEGFNLMGGTINSLDATPIKGRPAHILAGGGGDDGLDTVENSPTKAALKALKFDVNLSSAALDLESLTQFAVVCNKVGKSRFELAEVVAEGIRNVLAPASLTASNNLNTNIAMSDVQVYFTKSDAYVIENPITQHIIHHDGQHAGSNTDTINPIADNNSTSTTTIGSSSSNSAVAGLIRQCWETCQRVVGSMHTAYPIDTEGECLGVVLIAALPHALDPLAPMLGAIRNIAGLSVSNLLLLEDVQFQADKAEAMLQMATRLSRDALDEKILSRSIIDTAKQLTDADRCSVFVVKGDMLQAYFEDGNTVTMGIDTGIAGHVAKTGELVNIQDAYRDARFNAAVDKATGYRTRTILSMPVYYEGSIVAVAQLINKRPYRNGAMSVEQYFNTRDSDLFGTFSTFVGASLRNCRINQGLLQEKQKSQAILDVVTLLSNTDIRDVKGIVGHVMIGARKLLNADRASLFLVDKERNELYSEVADSTGGQQIRFPSGKGIAGSVAATGVAQNIRDAYTDDRFNRDFDVRLGYRTHSILCEPIAFRGEVLAVAQLMNKIDDSGITTFTAADEDTFRTFALFAGISISNSHLLQFAVKAGQDAMALGMRLEKGSIVTNSSSPSATHDGNSPSRGGAGVINTIPEVDRKAILNHSIRRTAMDIGSPNFDLLSIRDADERPLDAAAAIVLKIFIDSGLSAKVNCPDAVMANFVLHCRSKYRKVPYHNWYHAVDTCQTIYSYLTAGGVGSLLTDLECFAILATALVHDLDHMGVNNSFHLKTDSPLGILSSVSGNNSVLEVHHCNLAIEILEKSDANIFQGLSVDDTRSAFKSMIEAVLATDMARHGEILTKFADMCAGTDGANRDGDPSVEIGSGYDKSNEEHRRLLMQVLMKAADISNVTKPFSVSRQWAMAVTEEFYQQGDKEKRHGVEVLPMFDRSLNNELAKGQLGFIGFVAERFFTTIVGALLYQMQWSVDNIQANKAEWQSILAQNQLPAAAPKQDT